VKRRFGTVVGWWLEPGAEECPHCLQAFHYEALYVCRECDEPVCPACMVTIFESRMVVCPRCEKVEAAR
jgi:hypothetical protein